VFSIGFPCSAVSASEARVRRIILSSQHLGAHGMGYNTESMVRLSKRLTPADIPVLITLSAPGSEISTGARFALASQCEPAIPSVHQAAVERRMDFLDAQDTMYLMADFEGCSQDTRAKASAMEQELRELNEEEHARVEQEYKQKTENDARIQRNG